MTPVEFVAAWNAAESLADAAKAVGLSKASTSAKAARLRMERHRLKRFDKCQGFCTRSTP